jgi:hypothetical protein
MARSPLGQDTHFVPPTAALAAPWSGPSSSPPTPSPSPGWPATGQVWVEVGNRITRQMMRLPSVGVMAVNQSPTY